MMFRCSWLLGILGLCSALTGCGIHLQQSASLPPNLQRVYIDSSTPYTAFNKRLRRELQARHLNITNSAQQAQLILHLDKQQLDQLQREANIDPQLQAEHIALTIIVRLDTAKQRGKTYTLQASTNNLNHPNAVSDRSGQNQLLINTLQTQIIQQLFQLIRQSWQPTRKEQA